MSHSTDYDVIIVGGGPAGLSVGSELSKNFRVLVIDSRSEMDLTNNEKPWNTSKSWFCPYDSVDKENKKELWDAKVIADTGVTRFLARTYSGIRGAKNGEYDLAWNSQLFNPVPLNQRYPYLREHELLEYWKNVIRKNGSEMLCSRYYLDHRVKNEYVQVMYFQHKTNLQTSGAGLYPMISVNQDYDHDIKPLAEPHHHDAVEYKTCRLLIDASGVHSPILRYYDIIHNSYYYWSIYGCIAMHPPNSLRIGDYMLWQTFKDTNVDKEATFYHGRPIFEYEVLGKCSDFADDYEECRKEEYRDWYVSFLLIMYLRRHRVDREYMHAVFTDIICNENTFKYGDARFSGTGPGTSQQQKNLLADIQSRVPDLLPDYPDEPWKCLNKVLEITDLYEKLCNVNIKKSDDFSVYVKDLVTRTQHYRGKDFSRMNPRQQENIKTLNRLLLDEIRSGTGPKFPKYFTDLRIQEYKYGWYPSAGLTLREARDRVDFIGDAGSWTTPCGWGMSFIMANYKDYALALSKLLQTDNLKKKNLTGLVKPDRFQRTEFVLDKLVMHLLANGTENEIDKFVAIFNSGKVPTVCMEKMFTLKIEPREIFKFGIAALRIYTPREIWGFIPKREIIPLAIDAIYVVWEMILELFGKKRRRGFDVFSHNN